MTTATDTAEALKAHADTMELKGVEFLGGDGKFARGEKYIKTVKYTFHDGRQFHITSAENAKLDSYQFKLRKIRDDA